MKRRLLNGCERRIEKDELCCPFTRGRLSKNVHQLLIVIFKGPSQRRLPGRPGAGSAVAGIEKLGHTIRKLLMVVRVVDDITIARRAQQLRGAVVA